MIAGRPAICVSLRIFPVKVEPMIEIASNVWPSVNWFLAAINAMRADTAVPVGDRSIFPGRIATADRPLIPVSVGVNGPQNAQNEI